MWVNQKERFFLAEDDIGLAHRVLGADGHLVDLVDAAHLPLAYLCPGHRCAPAYFADEPVAHLATSGNLPVAPLAPFRIGEQERGSH